MMLHETIWDERTALERLLEMLPGFRGYHVAENRAEADALLRGFGRARLDRVRVELEERARGELAIPRKAAEAALASIHRLRGRLNRLCQELERESHPRLRSEQRSTPAQQLDPVYARDEEIVHGLVALSVAVRERAACLEALDRELVRIERALDRRRRLIEALFY